MKKIYFTEEELEEYFYYESHEEYYRNKRMKLINRAIIERRVIKIERINKSKGRSNSKTNDKSKE